MKKFITIFMVLAVMLSLLGVAASATSYRAGEGPVEFTVKKANSSLVVKDGVISAGEYEKAAVDTSEASSPLHVVYSDTANIDKAGAMLSSMEYYFSWDDTHGFNFAVRFKPAVLKQVLDVKAGEKPEDVFLKNVGLSVASDPSATPEGKVCDFFYAIAKRTDTGAYLQGHYGQFGQTGSYNPVAGNDFCIAYGDDGYATYEWSIPFDVLGATAGGGNNVYLTISATAGEEETMESGIGYGIAFGDYGFGVDSKQSESHAIATLSDDMIAENSVPNPDIPSTPNANNGSGNGTTNNGTTNNGDDTTNAGNGSNVTATQTSDPMLVLAAVSAISACGAYVIKKRRS